MVSKLSEMWSGFFIPDPEPDFLLIPDPGVKKAPDPQHCESLNINCDKYSHNLMEN